MSCATTVATCWRASLAQRRLSQLRLLRHTLHQRIAASQAVNASSSSSSVAAAASAGDMATQGDRVVDGVTHLTAASAAAVDDALMGDEWQFTLEQLMELAGLSVAAAVRREIEAPSSRILVIAGPGNNGGDGLVAARHLQVFGASSVHVCYPKPTSKPHYERLVAQLQRSCTPFVPVDDVLATPFADQYDLVVDAMFGFSFKGTPRPPFDRLLAALAPAAKPPKIVSVDVPSGWHVELGDTALAGIQPDVLVSLTTPKLCASGFQGRHYVGGRFIPPEFARQFRLELPEYAGDDQVVLLGH